MLYLGPPKNLWAALSQEQDNNEAQRKTITWFMVATHHSETYIYFTTTIGEHTMAKLSSFDSVERLFVDPSTTKTSFQRSAVKDLEAVCTAYSLNVEQTGKQGRSIKIDFVNALWKFVSLIPCQWGVR